ncbi:MAG: glycosyltransferase, partial [Candidatus Sumerlaeota bacterium]
RTAGTVQIIRDGVNGKLVDVDDGESLADCIESFMANRDQRIIMGNNARHIAEEQWSWKARATELESIIECVLSR